MSSDRTEKATPRRKDKAREKGDRPHSRELLSAAGLLAGALLLGLLARRWPWQWAEGFSELLALGIRPGFEPGSADIARTLAAMRGAAVLALAPLAILFVGCAAAAALAGVAEAGGLNFHAEALQPKWERINPAANAKNLVSLRSLLRVGKSLAPAAAIAALAGVKIAGQASLPVMSLERLPLLFAGSYQLLLDAALILLAWSAIDYFVERRSWERRLRMTRQEVRDEFKETEGSPEVRARVRSIQRQMRRPRLRQDVGRATVVVTNPTHYAVALSFDFDTMEAPKVLAKGRNLIAEEIKAEARWAGVPIVENPPLARSLYRSVEPGQSIPFELYAAVAGILAYLYRKQAEEATKRRAAEEAAAQPGCRDSSSAREESLQLPPAKGSAQ